MAASSKEELTHPCPYCGKEFRAARYMIHLAKCPKGRKEKDGS